jgi:hypothetical protein
MLKKDLKTLKGKSEAVNLRTANIMIKAKKHKRTNNVLLNSIQLVKDRVILKTGGELRCSGGVSSSCSASNTSHVNLVTNPVINHERGKKCLNLHF